ncbi:sarcosine oxidase subunit gamma [Profundibacter amoris]|uniref:Sarcosine oxidase subunit gamma n=1 Tax=Profundibacter amoris TaxID=2171755 RepID=A0A347UF93_9RHOB|nr:sarcosine oxidase subunit gamma family protein [Profundibacter amoris]AXX97521.1 sarcosine oxidase subunit gamma [Profundibacter amoris]
MSNAVSALQGVSSAGYVGVREMGLQGMITLRGDLSLAKIAKAVKSAVGVDMPAQRGINLKDGKGAAWMSPDELLLMMAYQDAEATVAKLQKALGNTHSLVVNVSDARAVFTLTGERVREVVAKLAPVDMATFTTGEIRRTRLAQVPAAFWMSGGDEITLVVFRSVAQYAFDLLTTAAAKGGEVW